MTLGLLIAARAVESSFWQQFLLDASAGSAVFLTARLLRIAHRVRLALFLAPPAAALLVAAPVLESADYLSSLLRALAFFLGLEVALAGQLGRLASARAEHQRDGIFAPIAFEGAQALASRGHGEEQVSAPLAEAAGRDVTARRGDGHSPGYRSVELHRPDVTVELCGDGRRTHLVGMRPRVIDGTYSPSFAPRSTASAGAGASGTAAAAGRWPRPRRSRTPSPGRR